MVFREMFVNKAEESMSYVGANVFAEWGLYHRILFVFCLFALRWQPAHSVGFICIRFRRVLFGMEARLD